jgi:Four helix bundle sensory module for signal transduction
MNEFLNVTIRTRLVLGFGLIILLLLSVMATAYRTIGAMQISQERLYSRNLADAINLTEFRSMNNRARADLLTMMFPD